jgi:hypothetical protein
MRACARERERERYEAFSWELKCNTISRNVPFKCIGTSYEINTTAHAINASFPKFPLKLSSKTVLGIFKVSAILTVIL